MEEREIKGLQIAATSNLQRSGDRWFVPSQSGRVGPHGGSYVVKPDPSNPHCTCPDYEFRKARCKHIFAVEYTLQREQTSDGQTVVTETLKVTKQTYYQEWPAYNAVQVNEKSEF